MSLTPRRSARLLSIAAIALALAASAPPSSADGDQPRVRAGGGLAATGGSPLELIGELWAELPLYSTNERALLLSVDTTTSVLGADGATFTVRELLYEANLELELDRRRRWRMRIGERGRQAVDALGAARVRSLMVERSGAGGRFRLALGPALEDRGFADDVLAAFDAELQQPLFERVHGELRLRGLWLDEAGLRTDSRLSLVWAPLIAGDHTLQLFASWENGRDPLGLGEQLWLAGFRYRTDERADTPWRERRAPDVNGAIAAVAGPRRGGRLQLEVVTPEFGRGIRLLADLDLNTLSGDTAHDLFYRYHAGFERDFSRGRAGLFYHHRSNHRLDGTIPGITSLDVIELGWSSGPRQRAGRPDVHPDHSHVLSAGVYAGLLLDSDFGEQRRWHLRARARYVPPTSRLYIEAEAATGDASRYGIGAGLTLGERFDLGVMRLADDQWFDDERRMWAINARYAF